MTLYGLAFGPFAEFGFMRRALVGCLALALGCGPIGTFLLIRRMSLIGDALSHAVLPGAALGFILGGLSLPAMTLGGVGAGLVVALLGTFRPARQLADAVPAAPAPGSMKRPIFCEKLRAQG